VSSVHKPTYWFEVEDFFRHFDRDPQMTGIQRACLEILAEAEQHYGASGRVGFCRLNLKTQEFERVEFSAILEKYACPPPWHRFGTPGQRRARAADVMSALRHLPRYVGVGILPGLSRWILRRFRGGRRASFLRPGDVIICLGAAWYNERYGRSIEAAKRDWQVRFVVLIHDLIPLTQASYVHHALRVAFCDWIREVLTPADLVLTVSRHSREELIAAAQTYGWTLPPLEIIRLGATFKQWRPRVATEPAVTEECASTPFVLCVSSIEPRKNQLLLVEVWRRLIARHGDDRVPDLVCIGRFFGPSESLRKQLLPRDGMGGKFRLLSDLSDGELSDTYRHCLFTVYPSFCEGWGLPVAESLAQGKFCIASDRTSLPEVGGDFIDYFDPGDIEDALAKIERPLLDPAYLAVREAHIREAYRPPSWSDCTRSLIEIVDRAFGSTTPSAKTAARHALRDGERRAHS